MGGSEPVNRGRATAFQSVTEFISQPMAAKRGRILAWTNLSALDGASLIPEAAIRVLWQCRGRFGAIRPVVVSTKRPMGEKRGNWFLKEQTFPPDARTSQSTRPILTSCSLRCGISGVK